MRRFLRLIVTTVLLSGMIAAGERPKRAIALTFDDLPLGDGEKSDASEVQDVNRRILKALRKHRAPAVGFVNEKKVEGPEREKRVSALEMWVTNGQTLGNHTYSHPDFNNLSVEQFMFDTERGETAVTRLLSAHGRRLQYFRYPFNHTGNTLEKKAEFENWLREHKYKIATCTVENTDWMFNRAYVKALSAGDKAGAHKIRSAYLDFTDAKLRFFAQASRDIAGREFPHVFLAHANRLNADTLDELLSRMEQSGYEFVSLDKAQADPIYRTPDNYVGEFGPMWAYRWAPQLKKKIDGKAEPEPPDWILQAAAVAAASAAK